MRIVGGTHRGLRLTPLGKGDPGAHLRPTSDRVRESLFSLLAARGLPEDGGRVLDLFAGTGALGLEAMSRGAAQVCFVESGRKALALLRANIAKARREGDAEVLTCDATRLPATANPCHLVFLDPPYGKSLGGRALVSALAGGWIAPDALVVWEEDSPQDPPPGFVLDEVRRYGSTVLTLLTRA